MGLLDLPQSREHAAGEGLRRRVTGRHGRRQIAATIEADKRPLNLPSYITTLALADWQDYVREQHARPQGCAVAVDRRTRPCCPHGEFGGADLNSGLGLYDGSDDRASSWVTSHHHGEVHFVSPPTILPQARKTYSASPAYGRDQQLHLLPPPKSTASLWVPDLL